MYDHMGQSRHKWLHETVLFYHVKQSISYGPFGRPMWPAHLAGSRRSEPRLGPRARKIGQKVRVYRGERDMAFVSGIHRSPAIPRKTLNTLRPRQNGCHFPIFKSIFLNENVLISIKISLKFVPKGPINNIPASVQIMAWRRPGDKPLSEPVMVRSLTHICVTRPQ